uniref:Nematode cuticle collagen N-terminal domain-containing protein n=1 Tax=Romanomermis culicivorax TaxID=13658 RepID=A0A915JB94_ROMCU
MTYTASARLAAAGALLLSFCTVFACFLFGPVIVQQANIIRAEIENDMSEFNILADSAWGDLMNLKRLSGVSTVSKPRHARNVACACNERNSCPAGAKGAPGEAGADGAPGEPGQPGAVGLPGNFPHVPLDATGKCIPCPFGKPGEKGPIGPAGAAGPKGANGKAGECGKDGAAGPPGASGNPGADGKRGAPGPQGERGPEGTRGLKGLAGPKGEKGAPGPAGPPGSLGSAGKPGNQGGSGEAGRGGTPGENGGKGPAGGPGQPGKPGKDAQYCPCEPRRNTPAPAPATNAPIVQTVQTLPPVYPPANLPVATEAPKTAAPPVYPSPPPRPYKKTH